MGKFLLIVSFTYYFVLYEFLHMRTHACAQYLCLRVCAYTHVYNTSSCIHFIFLTFELIDIMLFPKLSLVLSKEEGFVNTLQG